MSYVSNGLVSAMSRRPAVQESLCRSFKMQVAPAGATIFGAAPVLAGGAVDLGTLRLAAGKVVLGQHVIHEPKFSRNTVAWSQLADGVRTMGNLVFSGDGLTVAGQVHVARADQTLECFLVFGTTALTTFNTQYSTDGVTWTTGPVMEIGVEFDPTLKNGFITQHLSDVTQIVNVYGCGSSGNYQPVNYIPQGLASFSLNATTGTLQVNFTGSVTMSPPLCTSGTFGFPLPSGPLGGSAAIVYSQDGTSFSGTVYDFTGQTQYQFQGATADSVGLAAPQAPPADYRNFKIGKLVGDDLTVQELAGLQLPDVTTFSNALLFDCMLYVMDPTLRTNLTGQSQPTNLSQPVIAAITQTAETNFLNDYYAPTYFGSGFSSMSQFSSYFSQAQTTQLQYTASVVLAQQASYSVINNVVFSEAATLSSSTLESYVQDTQTNWGQTLYTYITQQPQIVQVQTEVFGANNTDTLNRYVSLLAVFDPTGKLSTSYYSAVMGSALFSQSTLYMDPGAAANTANLQNILPQILQQIINQWLVLPTDPTQGDLAQQQLAQELQAAADALGSLDQLAQELLNAFQYNGDQLALTARLAQMYTYFTGKTDLPAAVQKLAGFVGGLGLIVGITFTIQGLAQWSTLTTSQQIALIGQSMQVASTLIELLPEIVTAFVNGVQIGCGVVATLYSNWVGGANNFDDLNIDLSDLDEEDLVFNKDVSFNLGEIAENNFAEGKQLLFSYGPTFSKILKGVCIIGQVIAAGVAIYNVVEDIINGAPISQDIMDMLQAISMSVVAVCDVVQLFIESALAATLGVVFAIVGVIVAIIALFVGKSSPPPTPAQTYITNTVTPFANQQASTNPPPNGWSLPSVYSNATAIAIGGAFVPA